MLLQQVMSSFQISVNDPIQDVVKDVAYDH